MIGPTIIRKLRSLLSCLVVFSAILSPTVVSHARIIYVDASAKGNNTGTDWPNAWPCLQNALETAESGDSVWVAAGAYTPDQQLTRAPSGAEIVASGDCAASFQIRASLSLYGGFPKGGGQWGDRDPQKHETLLSGDLLGNDGPEWTFRQENSLYVVQLYSVGVVIDGLTIAGGEEGGLQADSCFLAPESSVILTLDNCKVLRNRGRGFSMVGCDFVPPTSEYKISNCTFIENAGGAIRSEFAQPSISQSTFVGNDGGAIYHEKSLKLILDHCSFYRNSRAAGAVYIRHVFGQCSINHCNFHQNSPAGGYGGAIYVSMCEPLTLTSCRFTANSSDSGGIVRIEHTRVASPIESCIFISNHVNRGQVVSLWMTYEDPTFSNCTFWKNAGEIAYFFGEQLSFDHCNVWDNVAPGGNQVLASMAGLPPSPDYFGLRECNIQENVQGLNHSDQPTQHADTVFHLVPHLTPDGHLTARSALIDLGHSNGITVDALDLDGDPRLTGAGLDIGSDEFVDTDEDHLPDWWEQKYFNDPNGADPEADPDKDGLTNLEEYEQYSSNPTATPLYVDQSNSPPSTLRLAIDAAQDGDTIIVPAGTYRGEGNRDLDFKGKAVVLRAPAGPEQTVIDCENAGRGFYFGSSETAATAIIGLTIANGQADNGGAIHCEHSHPQFRNCIFRNSHAPNQGPGGIYADLSSLQFHSCKIQNNSPTGMEMHDSHLHIIGDLVLTANDWHGDNVTVAGEGTVLIDHNTSLHAQDCTMHCNVLGPGTIKVPLENSLIIEKNAVVDLGGETGTHGRILCDGLLKVKDNAAILNADADIRRAKLEDNAIMHNCVINAEAGDPFGQFFVQDKAMIWLDRLISDGDRYLDVDPTEFQGTIDINSIDVSITEGMGTSRGGLFELRGRPGLAGDVDCHPENEFLCQTNTIPDFGADSWAVNTLELQAGAKLNLTNRFDFQEPYDIGSNDEVLYVKDLILGPGAILNTCFNQVVYQTLHLDPTAKLVNIPLLGFSLNNISFDDESEFLTRVIHNAMPTGNGDLIQRVVGEAPDPNGMMRMTNLTYSQETPGGGKKIVLVNARAKGLFAKSNENELLVQFEYQFCTPGGELVVYLSDVPELLGHGDPTRVDHYVEVARLAHPPASLPGSMGSDSFAVFTQIVSVENLDFVKGTRIEFELIGPAGSCIQINNWDPAVRCVALKCGDVAGNAPHVVDAIDFLAVMSEFGNRISDVNTLAGTGAWCLDSPFSLDGIVTLEDALAIEWAMEGLSLPCYQTGNASSSQRLNSLPPEKKSHRLVENPMEVINTSLQVIGKKLDPQQPGSLVDSLYALNEDGTLVEEIALWEAAHLGSKLICDSKGRVLQLDLEKGLVDPSNGDSLIPTGHCDATTEPRYGQAATNRHAGQERDRPSH